MSMRLASLTNEDLTERLHITRQEHTLAKEMFNRKTQRTAGKRIVNLISEFKRRKINPPSWRESLSYKRMM